MRIIAIIIGVFALAICTATAQPATMHLPFTLPITPGDTSARAHIETPDGPHVSSITSLSVADGTIDFMLDIMGARSVFNGTIDDTVSSGKVVVYQGDAL